jgi:hypothetical protein
MSFDLSSLHGLIIQCRALCLGRWRRRVRNKRPVRRGSRRHLRHVINDAMHNIEATLYAYMAHTHLPKRPFAWPFPSQPMDGPEPAGIIRGDSVRLLSDQPRVLALNDQLRAVWNHVTVTLEAKGGKVEGVVVSIDTGGDLRVCFQDRRGSTIVCAPPVLFEAVRWRSGNMRMCAAGPHAQGCGAMRFSWKVSLRRVFLADAHPRSDS